MRRPFIGYTCLAASALALVAGIPTLQAQQFASHPTPTEDIELIQKLEKSGALAPLAAGKGVPSVIDENDFVVFGYLQNADVVFHLRWQALTHVGANFTVFNSNGNFTNLTSSWNNRSTYLRAGGAAEAAGTKVIMVINSFADKMPSDWTDTPNFEDDPDYPGAYAIYLVFTDPARRATLVNNVVNALLNDPGNYSHGVNVDVEFTWNSQVRDGLTAFFAELRAALNAAGLTSHEVSVYTNPSFSSTRWNFHPTNGITPHIDYMIFSGYDWATGNTPNAISRIPSLINQAQLYMDNGLPPEKLVIAYSTYGRNFPGTNQFAVAGTGGTSSRGFTHGQFDTTIRRSQVSDPISDPSYLYQYSNAQQAAWYTYNDGSIDHVVSWDSVESLEYKFRQALSFGHASSAQQGSRIRGVSFWSLMWLASTSSVDMRTGNPVTRTRTYPHVYQLIQEVLSPASQTEFLLEAFNGIDPRWRNPSEATDTNNIGSVTVSRVLTPGGAGAPANSAYAAQLTIPFTGASNNRAVYAHEVLAHPDFPAIRDTNSVLGVLPRGTKVRARVHNASAYANYSVRMLVIDGNNQIEAGPALSLGTTGWKTMEWNLFDNASTTGFTTTEPGLSSGNGSVDSAGGRTRDIGFFGFLVQGSGAQTVTLAFDEITYEFVDPDGQSYLINEFTYSPNDREFVEIVGAPGVIPAGTELVVLSGSTGNISATFNLAGQSVPASGRFVVGDPAVANVNLSTGFSAGAQFPANAPTALQLRNSLTGHVYDSVVYRAYGGLGELVRQSTWGASGRGTGAWIGQIGNGGYTVGRYPDGANTGENFRDFSVMLPSPGGANGGAINTLPVPFSFATLPPELFFAFNWVGAGVTSTPPGSMPPANALRVADSTGGTIAFLGDAALGASGTGYSVSGDLYIQPGSASAQVNAVGFCGRMGSNFFSNTPAGAAYETGYWLAYQNSPAVDVRDGLANHSGDFVFYWTENTNRGGAISTELGRVSLASLVGVSAGGWAPFILSVNPVDNRLYAEVGGAVLVDSAIPAGAPTAGAVQFGHRQGTTAANDGTYVANLMIDLPFDDNTVNVEGWMLLAD